MDNQIKLNVSSVSHGGGSYSGNEDNFYINGRYMYEYEMENIQVTMDCMATDHIFAVSDGLDRIATEKRSSISMVKELKKFQDQLKVSHGDFDSRVGLLKDRLEETNNIIYSMSLNNNSGNPLIGEKETSIGSLFISEGKAATLNMGKTKIYLFRDGSLRPLTGAIKKSDKLLKMGIITNEQANILTGKFGIPIEDSRIGIQKSETLEVKIGDLFMICSDGLAGVLDEEKICEILSADKETGFISNMLVKEAIKNGSKDNITVLVVKIESQVNVEKTKIVKEAYTSKRIGARGNIKKSKNIVAIIVSICVILIAGAAVLGITLKLFPFTYKDPGPKEVDAVHAITVTEDSLAAVESTSETTDNVGTKVTNLPKEDQLAPQTEEVKPTEPPKNEVKPTVTPKNEVKPTVTPKNEIKPGKVKYTVLSGDSLQKISKKFYNDPLKFDLIMKANNIKNENSLQIGQVLIIP